MRNAYQRSQEDEILLADPVDLIVMLYRAAVGSVQKSRQALKAGDIYGRGQEIGRTIAILAELSIVLNHEVGGALSKNLAELYDYLQRQLAAAHQEQSDEKLALVESLLDTLLEGWVGCQQQLKPKTEHEELPAASPALLGAVYNSEFARPEAVSYSL